MGNKYTIGVDYGTQSGRAVLVNLADGQEIADHVTPYRHHVIDEFLPGSGKAGARLGASASRGLSGGSEGIRACRYSAIRH